MIAPLLKNQPFFNSWILLNLYTVWIRIWWFPFQSTSHTKNGARAMWKKVFSAWLGHHTVGSLLSENFLLSFICHQCVLWLLQKVVTVAIFQTRGTVTKEIRHAREVTPHSKTLMTPLFVFLTHWQKPKSSGW